MSAVTDLYKQGSSKDFGVGTFAKSFLLPGFSEVYGTEYLGGKYSEATTPKFPATPAAPVVPSGPSAEDTAAQEAAASSAERLRKKRGLKSTLLTGPGGVMNPATTKKTTLG